MSFYVILVERKLQKNIIRVEKSISEGRQLLEQHQINHSKGESVDAT